MKRRRRRGRGSSSSRRRSKRTKAGKIEQGEFKCFTSGISDCQAGLVLTVEATDGLPETERGFSANKMQIIMLGM